MTHKFSGHETFPCRYAWLPKAFSALNQDPKIFSDEEQAMVLLGVGKNMVKAIRFWVQVTGIAKPCVEGGGYEPTDFGRAILGNDGHDPFLEDKRTLWLIHWNISTLPDDPLFAWDYLLNRWQQPEISRTEILRIFEQEAMAMERRLSPVTLAQHFDTFLHTYVPTRSRKGDIQEDNLDCPLVELELIQKVGERDMGSGRREPLYAFRRESKPDITPPLFIYCLQDFWSKWRNTEKTLTFRDVAIAYNSPGQIFKLPEWDIRERLDAMGAKSEEAFHYHESAAQQHISRNDSFNLTNLDFLAQIYEPEAAYA
jgi:hypothetical protein